MEEENNKNIQKNVLKINFKLFIIIAVVVAIVAVTVVGLVIRNKRHKKIEELEAERKRVAEILKNSSNKTENETENATNIEKEDFNPNKEENSIEGTLNNNDTIKETASKTFSNDEIKKAIQEYLDLRGVYIGGPGELLVKLGFENYRENQKIGDYTKTNIKYIEYKDRMLNYMTEECLKKDFKECFKEINGYLYFVDGGASGDMNVVESIELKDNSSNFKYIANTYCLWHEYEIRALEFHIAEYNGKCVISYCE